MLALAASVIGRRAAGLLKWPALVLLVIGLIMGWTRLERSAGRKIERAEQQRKAYETGKRILAVESKRPRSRDDVTNRLRGGPV